MDYALEMSKGILEATRIENQNMLIRMEQESEVMVSCLELSATVLDLEAVIEASNNGGFIDSIKKFFKGIIDVFLNKVRTLTDRNAKWLMQHEEALLNMDVSGIKITIIPYWNISFDKIKQDVKTMTQSAFDDIDNRLLRKSINNDKASKMLKAITGVSDDKDGNVTAALKNVFRHGSPKEAKHIEISGGKLKTVIKEAIDYCKTYNTKVAPYLKNQVSYMDKEIARIDKKIKTVKENMIMIENTHILDSELRVIPNISSIVTEADKEKKLGNTTVDIQRPEVDEKVADAKVDKQNTVSVKSYNSNTKNELTYIRSMLSLIKMNVTAAMTVFEERYIAYINLLRGLKPEKLAKNESNIIKIDNSTSEEDKKKDGKKKKFGKKKK